MRSSHINPEALGDVVAALRAAADVLEDRARARAASLSDWIDQTASPLGRRRHCSAVRRFVAEGRDGAAIVGRRQLLRADLLGEALKSPKTETKATSALAEVERRLRLVGGTL